MGFLGLVLQFIFAVMVMTAGYMYQEASREMNLAIVFGAPFLFMIGTAIRRNDKTAGAPQGFFGMIRSFIGLYLTFLVMSAILFGIGVLVYYILVLRPAEGIGRYQ